MTTPFEDLPYGWTLTPLADLGAWAGGGTPSKSHSAYWDGGDVPWVSPKDMKVAVLVDTQDHITHRASTETSAKQRPVNSVAFVVRSGILEHTLPVALVPFEASYNQDMKVLTPAAGIDPRWLATALRGAAPHILEACRKDGTTVASLDYDRLRAYEIPVPPPDEQAAVLARVERALAQADAIDEEIVALTRLTRQFRQSALQSALTGGFDGGSS